MVKRVNYEIEKEMNRALIFLSKSFYESGQKQKPVVLHSIRVALNLFYQNYDHDIVIAAILHDILEDTKISSQTIVDNFGLEVLGIITANTFDDTIESKDEQNIEMFNRCKNYGRNALIVKCADISDNINVFKVENVVHSDLTQMLLRKYHNFLKISEPDIGNERIYLELKMKVKNIDNQIALLNSP